MLWLLVLPVEHTVVANISRVTFERCAHQPEYPFTISHPFRLLSRSRMGHESKRNGRSSTERKDLEAMATKMSSVAARPARTQPAPRALRSRDLAPYLFVLPFGLLFTLFFIVPIIYALFQ